MQADANEQNHAFSGSTRGGETFNMTISGATLSGSVQLQVGSQFVTANASCTKIY